MAVASAKRYLLTLVAIAFVTQIAYSLFSVITDDYVPTVGLSGVVTGVIGMSAYLIPRARVRTFVWFFVNARNHFIPAWVLAAWYICGDILDLYDYGMDSGINFISHISGGISGYLIGYFYFKEHKNDIKDEVDDAIDYARSLRQDTGIASTYRGDRARLERKARERDSKRNHDRYMSQLYNFVEAKRDSDAIMLVLEDYDIKHHSEEIFEELFDRMLQWGPSRALLCTGRLLLDLYLHDRHYLAAINIARQCHKIAPEFVLADSVHVLVLAKQAMGNNEYDLARMIVQNVNERYGNSVDTLSCALLEVELLWMHLDKPTEARELIANLLTLQQSEQQHEMILSLAKTLG